LTLSGSVLTTTDVTQVGLPHHLEITVSATDYATPSGTPLLLTSAASLSSINSLGLGTDSVTFQSWVDTGDGLFGKSDTSGLQSVSGPILLGDHAYVLGPNPATKSFDHDPFSPFSITSTLTYDLGVGDTSAFATTATVSGPEGGPPPPPVPVPAGLALVLSGLPVLGVGYWARRKKRPAGEASRGE
jgi:hypothetical protein